MKRFLLFLCLVLTGAVSVQATGDETKAAEARTPEELVQNLYLVLIGDKPADELKTLFANEADLQLMATALLDKMAPNDAKRFAREREFKLNFANYGEAAQQYLSNYLLSTSLLDVQSKESDTKLGYEMSLLNCILETNGEGSNKIPLVCVNLNGIYKLVAISNLKLNEEGKAVFPEIETNDGAAATTVDAPPASAHEGHDH